jgi:hyperosmotically inducible periplasmic protein
MWPALLKKEHIMKRNTRYAALITAALASTLIVACGEREDATVGQQIDSTSTELRADAREAGKDMQAAGSEAADKVAIGAADVAITAKVNAALAADDQLSALKINVDTTNGQVELKGTAPDAASRDRATMLASAVEGVVKVENRLTVEAKG